MPAPFDKHLQPEETKRLLAGAPVIRNACELDVLLFLDRHPRALLTSEQLAGFVGYDIKDIAKALESFIEAGLLGRTSQQSMHAVRMFLLLLDGPQGGGLRALLELASTREGRQGILQAVKTRGARPEQPGAAPERGS